MSRGPDVTDVVVAAGAVWAASSRGRDGPRAPTDGSRRGGRLRVGARPLALAADERRVVAVDAGAGRSCGCPRPAGGAGRPIPLGGAPVDVALDGNEAWVVDAAAGTLQRVDVVLGTAAPAAPVCPAPVAVAADAGPCTSCAAATARWCASTRPPAASVTRVRLRPPPTALALGPRHVWIAAGDHEVIRVDR